MLWMLVGCAPLWSVNAPADCSTTDADGDGWTACAGTLFGRDDCNDNDPSVFPNADLDGDGSTVCNGWLTADDCDDSDPQRFPGADEPCDDLDNDCDSRTDEDGDFELYADRDGDGWGDEWLGYGCAIGPGEAEVPGDCDDIDPDVHPDATEVCNGGNDDCDDYVDEGLTFWVYDDPDGDGYGDGWHILECDAPPDGTASHAGDCANDDPDISPGTLEDCANGVDDDCDGLLDCADPECAAACQEVDCTDGLDDDQDGAADCADDDCAVVCDGGVQLQVTAGTYTRSGRWTEDDLLNQQVDATNVTGRLRWSGGVCTWTVGQTEFSAGTATRVDVDEVGCPDALPYLLPDELDAGRWGLQADGVDWFVTKALARCEGPNPTRWCDEEGTLPAGGWLTVY